jgi:hypothetical protein
MSMEILEQLRGEQERILAFPGRAASSRVARLACRQALCRQRRSLDRHLNRIQDPTQRLPVWAIGGCSRSSWTERYLHNDTADGYTRMDCLRRFISAEWPESSPFRE